MSENVGIGGDSSDKGPSKGIEAPAVAVSTTDASPASTVPAGQGDPMPRLTDEDIFRSPEFFKQGLQIANEYLFRNDAAGKDDDVRKVIESRLRQLFAAAGPLNVYFNSHIGPNIKNNSGVVASNLNGAIDQRQSSASVSAETKTPDDATARLWSFGSFVLSQDRVPDFSYILAIASLSGAPLSTVNRAADELAARLAGLQQSSNSERQAPSQIQIATPRRILLAEVGCEIVAGASVNSNGDELSGDRIRFRDPGMDQTLLRDAWMNLRLSIPWMTAFLGWLSGQGNSPDFELRLAAGRTVGNLATWDADASESILFDAWISGHALDALETALIALSATSSSAVRYVENRLTKWAEGQAGKDRIITAALLACGAFGHAQPDLAFRLLASLVCQKRRVTLDLAAMGYVVWFAAAKDDPKVGSRVIQEVAALRSAYDSKVIQKLTGAYFLMLTSALDDEDDDAHQSELLFLDVLGATPEALQVAAQIFNELLAPNIHAKAALERFRSIVFSAFRSESRHQQTFFMLADAMHLKGDEDERDTLRYWLKYWSDEIEEASAAAGYRLSSWLEKSSRGEVAL